MHLAAGVVLLVNLVNSDTYLKNCALPESCLRIPSPGKPVHSSSPLTTVTSTMVVDTIAGIHPDVELPLSVRSATRSLHLADPLFYKPGQIDVLLGADVFGSLLQSDVIQLQPCGLTAISTNFGYILSGPVTNFPTSKPPMTALSLTQVVERFWKIEEPPEPPQPNPLDIECETLFKTTTTRNSDGTFVTRLPFLSDRPSLGETRGIAEKRFLNLEKRLQMNPRLKSKYIEFMREYQSLNHMSVSSVDLRSVEHYYVPHHGVFKASDSEKLRVVFDGSSKSSNGISLNECLHTGPKLQRDITHILLNFRRHAIVFVTDIRMMFRMSWIHPEDRRFQLILWRESPSEPLLTYELNTNTYGLRSSPYIAIRVLLELAEQERSKYPRAAAVIESDVYVDDCLTGASTLEEARDLKIELQSVMRAGGYELRKWLSNKPELLNDLPPDYLQPLHTIRDVENPQTVAVLGVQFNPVTDAFTYTTRVDCDKCPTKRKVLSLIARTFDPSGWISPIVFKAKVFIQRLWLSGLDWDAPLTPELTTEWLTFTEELMSTIQQISIPRCIFPPKPQTYTLHGFSDASEAGFAAVIYLRAVDQQNNSSVHLLMSKTKVSPVRTRLTIPKLELQGAALLSKLVQHVVSCLQKSIVLDAIYTWTDSQITLAWLNTSPHELQTFEANRVSQIKNAEIPSIWRHVPGSLNPADCASRGLSPRALLNHPLWWCPKWLLEPPSSWPSDKLCPIAQLPGLRCLLVTSASCIPSPDFLLERFSSFQKLIGTRPKWASHTEPPVVGDLVLLREENVPPLEWRRGRIISIRPGKDGVVRVVQVRTATGVLTRPTNRIIRLPVDKPVN
ncbi:uncharacterized protein LOC134751700 [Cydia strobilella]|uniref:uncharacterized protein LOC134751700 n=1 Tax=Cydia strobilella TaxID=1100964 RepID=UPI003006B05F